MATTAWRGLPYVGPDFFNIIPIEATQNIASFIELDKDLCAFRAAGRTLRDAIEADSGSFWRRRFLDIFERPVEAWNGGKGNLMFKNAYQKRRSALKCGAQFTTGGSEREKMCLEVVRDLVVDSFSEKHNESSTYEYDAKNLQYVKKFVVDNYDMLMLFMPQKTSRRFGPPSAPSRMMQTLQAICAPMLLSFNPTFENHHYGFPDSQTTVYSTIDNHPIFTGCHHLDVSMPYVLHNLNFWKYHMLREAEGTLYYPFSDLEHDEQPRWWDSQFQQGIHKLGKHWKGSYAFVERGEIDAMRAGGNDEQIQDVFAGEDGFSTFQDMTLQLTDDDESAWPLVFEQHLRSLTPPESRARTRAQQRSAKPEAVDKYRPQSFHFEGEGQDVTEKFLASGWLKALPPQEGIPGWQRLTMMKYFEDEDGSIDHQGLWAYEGVVLPGGQIVVGRWWSPTDDDNEGVYSGPFILWCVDGAKNAEQAEDGDE